MIIANCLYPRFAVKALEDPEYHEQLKKCMKVIVGVDLEFPNTPIFPRVSSPSKIHKSLFQKRKNSSAPQLDMIEEELFNFKNLAKYVTDDVEIDPQVWWISNGKPMPILFKLSQVYLISTTSIAQNSFFLALQLAFVHLIEQC